MTRLRQEIGGILALTLALLFALPLSLHGADRLVSLARPGPWSAVSALIGYRGRIWFVNSVKFIDHNSADVYSYDPASGAVRYERHLFSQDAGRPATADGLLYWPFEDARFSAGRGEYMVTNGRDWQWRILPEGEVFHVHAMVSHHGAIYAATSAWRAGLQRSEDGGLTWRVIYDHPTPPFSVTRIVALASFGDTLYAGLSDSRFGIKLLRLRQDSLHPVPDWPAGRATTALAAHGNWLYGVNAAKEGTALWRTDGKRVQPISALDSHSVRELASGAGYLWAATSEGGGGRLWRSRDGTSWSVVQSFEDEIPLEILIYGGRAYVGTHSEGRRGALWGPPPPAPSEPPGASRAIPAAARPQKPDRLSAELQKLDRILANGSSYAHHARMLRDKLQNLAQTKMKEVGRELTLRLQGAFPDVEVAMFGGDVRVYADTVARWYLLRSIALAGQGRVSPEFVREAFIGKPSRSQKYLYLGSAAAWAAGELGQDDADTVDALIEGVERKDEPLWLKGDFVGALTAVTGQRFGYDLSAWSAWRSKRGQARMDK